MKNDLLARLVRAFFTSRRYPPDKMSIEWDYEDHPFILLQWDNGTERIYPYSEARYNAAFAEFNKCWQQRLQHQ